MSQIEIESLLYKTMGLDSASIGRPAIERAVERRMAAVGTVRVEEYWNLLRSATDEVQELIEAVVVPETSFFRHGEAFSALQSFVTGQWLPSRRATNLRVLSVPCSTGEEPYSIVMSLLDSGLAPDKFSVEAWDISRRAIAYAQRAVYGKNSFRTDLGFRDRYFDLTPGGYEVRANVRRQVTFRQCNLVIPESCSGPTRFEIVFCRNVLIYFDRSTQEQALKNLERLLAPDGVLFVGPAEALLMRGAGFVPTSAAMSFAFKRGVASRPAPFVPAPLKPLPKLLPKPVAPLPKPVPVAVKPVGPTSFKASLEAARQLADAGRMAEAAPLCEAYLREQGDSAEGHYLLGLIRDVLGDAQSATQSYRKALYLNPNHSEALVHLALLAERRGDAGEAQRLQERARRVAGR